MEIIEQVSLVDFYRHQTKALRARGFFGLMMVLARQADAPNLYMDLIRYWNDLHHITGPRILFAVAGMPQSPDNNKALVFDGVHNDALMIAPHDALTNAYWDKEDLTRHLALQKQYLTQNKWWKPEYKQAPTGRGLAAANASQVSELRHFLHVSEAQTPCLHLTLLLADASESFIMPLDDYSGLSLWVSVKRIMSRLSPPIDEFDRTLRSRKFGRLPELDVQVSNQEALLNAPNRRIREIRSIASESKRLKQGNIAKRIRRKAEIDALLADPSVFSEERSALTEVIQYCSQSTVSKEGAWKLFNSIRGRQLLGREVLRSLQGFVDASLDPSDEAALAEELTTLTHSVDQLSPQLTTTRSEIKRTEDSMRAKARQVLDNRLATEMNTLCASLPQKLNLTWDFFISYPRPDRDVAIALWRELSDVGECFFDQRSLKPGDKWANELISALENSSCIVVLVTEATLLAHYQISEIQRAVDWHRKKATSILVAQRDGAALPLGLEQFQSLIWKSEAELRSGIRNAFEIQRIVKGTR